MPDNLFTYESVGVYSKSMLTRKAKSEMICQSRGRRISLKAIYKITNKLNNKSYIGQTNNPSERFKKHKWLATTGQDKGKSAIHDALRNVGIENFTFEILGWFEDYNEKEKYYIQLYNTMIPNGYNIMPGGEEPPHKYGEEHHNSTYSQELIDKIIDDLISHKYTQKEIEQRHNVSQQLITSVNRGVTHRRPGLEYPIIKTSKYHCDDETFEKICYLLKYSKCTCEEIGRYFGLSSSAVKAMNSGRNHYDESIKYPIRNFRGQAGSQSVEAILAKRSTGAIDTHPEM